MSNQQAYSAFLELARLSMAAATFNAHVVGLQLAGVTTDDDGAARWHVVAVNDRSAAWLRVRLLRVLETTASGATGASVRFEVYDAWPDRFARPAAEPDRPATDQAPAGPETFEGFGPARQNWVKTPSAFFDYVLPNSAPTVSAVVGAIIRHTRGFVVNPRTSATRECWRASIAEVAAAAGISRTGAALALDQARAAGYIVREPATGQVFAYRLREIGEPVDLR